MARRGAFAGGTRAQSETVGVALLLGLTILGTVAVVAFGAAALTDTEQRSQVQRAQQVMTLFDSQAAQVAVGDSTVQTVELGGSGGTYRVDPGAGTVNITHFNHTGTGDNATLLETTALGAVIYENGDTTVAYQGGGVWRTHRSGNATMISPPEFHFRGATLTFPIIVTEGDGSVSGRATAVVDESLRARPVYTNASASYPNGDDYTNPITDGTVVVEIESAYSRAWGAYFDDRTEGNVTYPDADTVRIELIGVGDLGEFDMPGEGGSINVPGAEGGHSVDEFSITVRPDDEDSADFANLQWSMYAQEGDQRFELHLSKGSGTGCPGTDREADATIYYSDDGGTTYHGWKAVDAFDAKCDDLDGDGDEEIYFEITLVDDENGIDGSGDYEPGDVNLTYQSLSKSDLEHFSLSGATLASPTLDGHGGAGWEPETPAVGDELTTDMLVNHYFGELPNEFALTVDDKNSDTINEDASSGILHTTGAGKFVTFLHVTENRIRVRLR